ncbi:MAG: bleomycin resistance family protein [Blastocatellia bacterium]|nr:bleomycin resistance family protein [Blastocatellia bacterium]
MKIKHLTPMLGTLNLQRTIKFYKKHLGFECLGIYPDKESPCWASLWNGDVEIAFSSYDKKLSMTGNIYLYVENVVEIWERLQDKVEIVYPLKDFDYGMREFGIRDCNGYILNIGQNIE